MRYMLIVIFLTGFLTLSALAQTQTQAQDDECEMLFVQDAKGMTYGDGLLTLQDANPNIIFFCDRPVRTAGHLTRDAFMKLVSEGENAFKDSPPNAAISIFGSSNELTEVVVTLIQRPVTKDDKMIFSIKVLDGKLPKNGGAVVMFIDPIGRPLSPTSRAGVHRRHERRAVRRH